MASNGTVSKPSAIKGVAHGTCSASKSLIVDSSKNITGIGTVGCGAITTSGNLGVTGTITCDTSLTLDTTTLTTAELGVLDGVTAGQVTASKSLVVDGSLDLNHSNCINDLRVDSLGVGTAASGTSGEIRATNDITAYYSSDKRLKDKIQPIQEPLTKLDTIGGYTFEWIPKEGVHSHEGTDVGVIAQEIEGVLPEIVTTRDNGYKAVRYEKIVPLLIESIKAQQLQINSLRERIKLLEKNNE